MVLYTLNYNWKKVGQWTNILNITSLILYTAWARHCNNPKINF